MAYIVETVGNTVIIKEKSKVNKRNHLQERFTVAIKQEKKDKGQNTVDLWYKPISINHPSLESAQKAVLK